MSTSGVESQSGSPTAGGGAGQPGLDGTQIALQMIQATSSAAQAAQAAADALQQLQSQSTGGGTDEKSWYKLLPKPGAFEPSSREDEIAKWRDWSWQLEQFLGTLDPRFVAEIDQIRKAPSTVTVMPSLSEEEKRRSIFLCNMLASVLRNRPLLVLKAIKNFNGYECFRELVSSNEPLNKNRSMSLLSVIMNWPTFSPTVSYLSQIMKLESAFEEYERTWRS